MKASYIISLVLACFFSIQAHSAITKFTLIKENSGKIIIFLEDNQHGLDEDQSQNNALREFFLRLQRDNIPANLLIEYSANNERGFRHPSPSVQDDQTYSMNAMIRYSYTFFRNGGLRTNTVLHENLLLRTFDTRDEIDSVVVFIDNLLRFIQNQDFENAEKLFDLLRTDLNPDILSYFDSFLEKLQNRLNTYISKGVLTQNIANLYLNAAKELLKSNKNLIAICKKVINALVKSKSFRDFVDLIQTLPRLNEEELRLIELTLNQLQALHVDSNLLSLLLANDSNLTIVMGGGAHFTTTISVLRSLTSHRGPFIQDIQQGPIENINQIFNEDIFERESRFTGLRNQLVQTLNPPQLRNSYCEAMGFACFALLLYFLYVNLYIENPKHPS